MSDYSEKQLLLLSNLVYLPCCLSDSSLKSLIDGYRSGDGTFTEESVEAAGVGGGMSNKDIVTLFNEFDKEIEKDPSFGELSPSRKLNGGYVRAVCYTDKNDENAVVVYRGTGGSHEAWTDNFEGGYENDTQMQTLAADFIRNECGIYDDITVTGHSKGGNLSQYVTVKCGESVARCVSFDGQGFNDDFIADNKAGIEAASDKITSVCAYNDFVNILLTSIAGSTVYLENEDSIAMAHSSLALLINNKYDDEGNFLSKRSQSLSMKALKALTDNIADKVRNMDDRDGYLLSYIIGCSISSAFTVQSKEDAVGLAGRISGNIASVFAHKLISFEKLVLGSEKVRTPRLYYDGDKVKGTIAEFAEIRQAVGRISTQAADVSSQLAYSSASKVYTLRSLDSACENLARVDKMLTELSKYLSMVSDRYEKAELRIQAGAAEGQSSL